MLAAEEEEGGFGAGETRRAEFERPQMTRIFPAEATINEGGELGVLGGRVPESSFESGGRCCSRQDPRVGIWVAGQRTRLPGRRHAYLYQVMLETKAIAKSTAKPWKSYWQRPHVENREPVVRLRCCAATSGLYLRVYSLWHYSCNPEQERDDYTRRI